MDNPIFNLDVNGSTAWWANKNNKRYNGEYDDFRQIHLTKEQERFEAEYNGVDDD